MDSLKSGITKASLTAPKINPTFSYLALHYGTAASPARPEKPQDKAKVESAVQQVGRRVPAPLRCRCFFSLAEVNQALRPMLDALHGGERIASHVRLTEGPKRLTRKEHIPPEHALHEEMAAEWLSRGARAVGERAASLAPASCAGGVASEESGD